jgi:hypothetical protein
MKTIITDLIYNPVEKQDNTYQANCKTNYIKECDKFIPYHIPQGAQYVIPDHDYGLKVQEGKIKINADLNNKHIIRSLSMEV